MVTAPPDDPLTLVVESDDVTSASMTRGRIGQIFGGQLAAHSLSAGVLRAAPSMAAHSLHLVFVASGDADERVRYRSTVVKAGRSVTVVRVDALQGERVLATSLVQCHGDEWSGEHGIVAPEAPVPDACRPLDFSAIGGVSPVWAPVEARYVEITAGSVPAMRVWLRWTAALPDEPYAHAAALAWMSDLPMLRTSRLGSASEDTWTTPGASLDHALWLHRRARADDWLLLDVRSPVRTGARSLSEARLFDVGGLLVASATQECLVR